MSTFEEGILQQIETVENHIIILCKLYPEGSRTRERYSKLLVKCQRFKKAAAEESGEIELIKTALTDFLEEAEKHRGYSRYIREAPILKSIFYGLTVITNMFRLLWNWKPWTKEAVFMDKKTTSSEKVLGIKSAITISEIAKQNKATEEQRKINKPFNDFLGAETDYQAIQKIKKITKERVDSKWLMTLDKDPTTFTPEERKTRFEGKSFFVLYGEQLYFIHPLPTKEPILLNVKPENETELKELFEIVKDTSKQSTPEQYSIIFKSVHTDSFNKTILGADDTVPIMALSVEEEFKQRRISFEGLKEIASSSSTWQFPEGNKIFFKESIKEVKYDSNQKYPVSVMTLDGLFLVSQSTTSIGLQIIELLNKEELTKLNLLSYNTWISSGQIPKEAVALDAEKIDEIIHSKDPTLPAHHMGNSRLESYLMMQYCGALNVVTSELIENWLLLKQLPESVKNPKISALIERYNALIKSNQFSAPDKIESRTLMKLFLLQKIDYLLQKENSNFELLTWQSQLGPSGIEAHLQKYGISRDASTFLKNIEFANAVKNCNSKEKAPTSVEDFFTIIRQRDTLFDSEIGEDTLKTYFEYNQSIMTIYDKDKGMQDKVLKSKHFLSLCYAKMDSIKGFVKQKFADYETAVLGNLNGNNKNFTLTVDGEEEKLVIRVEDRKTLASEQILQAHSVSEYFSADYVTFMMPFEINGIEEYRPVVLSEFAKKGSLYDYAKSLTNEAPDEIGLQAVKFFTQLNDFCLKLIESGHYHPDIKLSNFLTDGERIIVSDRKTITDKKNPKVTEINSSPAYGAPEYKKCLLKSGIGVSDIKGDQTTLDMPAYMSYQQGMALAEFFGLSGRIDPDSSSDRIKNISVLTLELTRDEPSDRLSIANFQSLLYPN